MERRTNPYAPEIIHNFLQDAIKDGAIKRFRKSKGRRCKKPYINPISRQLNAVAIFVGTPLTQTDIARIQHTSPQAVSRAVNTGLKRIWQNGSPELQANYPFATLKVLKSKSASARRITPATMETASRKLKNQKQKEKRQNHIDAIVAITNIIENSEDKELTQNAVDILTRYLAEKLAQKENSPFISLSKALHHQPRWKSEKVYHALKKAGIPVMKLFRGQSKQKVQIINYYVVKRFANEALEYLAQSPLKNDFKSKVEQIAGPASSSVPSTYEFSHPKKHKKIRSLIHGIRLSDMKGVSHRELLENSPVPVFRYPTKTAFLYIFPKDKEAELKEFLEKRLKELGISHTHQTNSLSETTDLA